LSSTSEREIWFSKSENGVTSVWSIVIFDDGSAVLVEEDGGVIIFEEDIEAWKKAVDYVSNLGYKEIAPPSNPPDSQNR